MKLIVLFSFFISTMITGQRADFFKEDITFRLDGIHFKIEGYYWFTNNFNKSINSNIFYPFPNYNNEKIDSIKVFNISAGEQTEHVNEAGHGISFNMFIEPGDTVLFRICCRQELKSDSSIYILRTTKGWGKPLTKAEFKLITPASFEIKKFSYTPDKLYEMNDVKIYYWMMENFMPVQNMIFYF